MPIYAIVARREMYGPRTERRLVTISPSRAAAVAEAARLSAAELEPYGCPVLEHGQAAATEYVVRHISPHRCARGHGGFPLFMGQYLPIEVAP